MANNDLEWSTHLEEYKNLTDEIKRRVSYQLLNTWRQRYLYICRYRYPV